METGKSSNLYLLTGLIFGIAIGLVISLMIMPAVSREASPAVLTDDAKAAYRLIIAKSFVSDFNLARAQSRLALLEDGSVSAALSMQIQSFEGGNAAEADVQALQKLLDALSLSSNSALPAAAP